MIKFDGTTIADAEGLDLVMSMHNLLECRSNYFLTILFFFSKDKATDCNVDIVNLMLLSISSINPN